MPLMSNVKAIFWSSFWVISSIIFSIFVFKNFGLGASLTYLGCYSIELLLSIDNLLMFYVIFKYFKVSKDEQRRALNIGLLSSFILRAVMIFSGSTLIGNYPWISYLFAGFLIYSGGKLFLSLGGNEGDPKNIINLCQKYIPKLSMFGVMIVAIEIVDILFAVDSIPASFGITNNGIIIYSANLLAILGLRSMYFVLLNFIEKISWLEKVISIVLVAVGFKMFIQTIGG